MKSLLCPPGSGRMALLLLFFLAEISFPSFPTTSCTDEEQGCAAWAKAGECERNVGFMKLHACRASCGSCDMDTQDLSPVAVRASPAEEVGLMQARAHGTCTAQPEAALRWGVDAALASQIGCFNRKGAEPSGYFENNPTFISSSSTVSPMTFYDSATRRPLFVAPRNRTWREFLDESRAHGWPSFRDDELVAEAVRVLRGHGGEIVSVDGTHLGHNLPDARNRYCINLVSVAGMPPT